MTGATYAELAVQTCFSFLRGASLPDELVVEAADLGLAAIAVTDRNTLSGVVRVHAKAKQIGLRCVIGARLVFSDGTPDILAYPEDREGYARLSRMLTRANTRPGVLKGECRLYLDDLIELCEGLCMAVVPPEQPGEALELVLSRLIAQAPDRVWLAAAAGYGPADARRLDDLADLAAATGARLLAINDVLYHHPHRRKLQDVMTCIREHTTLQAAGRLLQANAERHLKSPAQMARLFRQHPDALAETIRLLERCCFSLDELAYEYPHEPVPPGKTAQQHLEDLSWAGAARRYPDGIPDKVRKALAKEFAFIAGKKFAHYFLTVHDVVAYARSVGILCQGRGSAANSAVCFCLGVTAVDPMQVDLLFERFISNARGEPPDIDVDFEHERREEVIQHIYGRYGRHRAAICATVIHYRPRSAIREVGKALGLTEDVTAALAGTVWGSWGDSMPETQVREAGLDPDNPVIRLAVELANELIGFPRHLSQHVGGFILTERRLDETVPIANGAMKDRTFIEWDKDDIDALGIMKVDVLALGMLTCIKRAFALLKQHGVADLTDMADIRDGDADPAVYDMLCLGDSIGVFQVESRAQINMLPRLRPRTLYDLTVEVAIVRPGPIQGDMVHPYLKRRNGIEPIVYASPSPEHGHPDELKRVLERTHGVPLFQEQAMQIAIDAAGFTPSEADGLRRAMATFKSSGKIDVYREQMVGGMVRRGYPADFAERCFKQIEGFGSYGFPESHAASFAKLVYVSAWLKCHHPAVFAAALLNSQPMGFYAPAQIVRDAREHGVEVRAVDVEHSLWDCTLERDEGRALALRLGLRLVDGFSQEWAEQLVLARSGAPPQSAFADSSPTRGKQGESSFPLVGEVDRRLGGETEGGVGGPFQTFDALVRRSGLTQAQLQKLAEADALRSLGLERRAGLWAVRGVEKAPPAPLLKHLPDREVQPELPLMSLSQQVVADYQTVRLSLKAHPMSFLRERFAAEGVKACEVANGMKDGASVATAGVVLVRQRPGNGKVCFITLEDETGVSNLVVLTPVFQKYRKVVMGSRLMAVHGRIQKSPEGVTHVMAYRLVDRTAELARLDAEPDLLPDMTMPADEVRRDTGGRLRHSHPRDVRIIPPSRDFH